MKKYPALIYTLFGLVLVVLLIANLAYGSVAIPLDAIWDILTGGEPARASWRSIVIESRIPQGFTALFAGASLAVSGLLLQTLFKNPLAGPSILGISDGANLGVAIVMLYSGGSLGVAGSSLGGNMAIILAAFIGAAVVLGIIIWFSGKVHSNVMLLIIGIMVGYIASSFISILNYYASADKIHSFVMWGMGDFTSVSIRKLPLFSIVSSVGLLLSILLIKPLNALLLGETYAANLGVHIKRTRILILLCTGILTATTTAFCGPIAFIGLAVPHIARLLLGSSNHKILLPVTLLTGACIALFCNLLTTFPGINSMLPLNAITPLICSPVIIYVIVNRKNVQYFN